MKKCIFLFMLFFLLNITANADCTYTERQQLLKKAKDISIGYDIEDKSTTIEKENSMAETTSYVIKQFDFNFYVINNYSNELYVKYVDDMSFKEEYINADDLENNTYHFTNSNKDNVITYTFEIRTLNENCKGKIIETRTVKKPKYNSFSEFPICDNDATRNQEYCQQFITKDLNMTEWDLFDKGNQLIKQEEKEKKEPENESVFKKLSRYWYIIVIIAGVALVVGVVIIINKRRGRLE